MNLHEIVSHLNLKAPHSSAESWDNVGLLVGEPSRVIQGAVVCTDLNEKVLNAAVKIRANLIVVHHPVIFPKQKGIAALVPGHFADQMSSLIFKAIEKKIAIYSSHTNFDRYAMEVVDQVSEGLGITPVGRLMDDESLKKLIVYVPETHAAEVFQELSRAGAGTLGNYDSCSFQIKGEGTFRPNDRAKPYLGKEGQIERVSEVRLEMIYPAAIETGVIQALRSSHPYEEIAYDLIEVTQSPTGKGLIQGMGYGVFGDYEKPQTFDSVFARVQKTFHVKHALVSGTARKIRRVAYTPGKGSSFVRFAVKNGCDLMVTGEVGYHGAMDAARAGMIVAEIGHPQSECFFASTVQKWLREVKIPSKVMRVEGHRFA